jgi:endonuclease YncB( thermonuclease family)
MKTTGLGCMMLVAAMVSAANTITGKVVEVIDGNTLMVRAGAEQYRLVLLDIDCPDQGQAYAEAAAQHTRKALQGKTVTVTLAGKDRWGNYTGMVYLKSGKDFRHELVSLGMAWVSEKCTEAQLHTLQQQAQKEKRGLWADESPTPPWVYRRQQSMMTPKSS